MGEEYRVKDTWLERGAVAVLPSLEEHRGLVVGAHAGIERGSALEVKPAILEIQSVVKLTDIRRAPSFDR